MDLSYGAEYDEFREEVRRFLENNWSREHRRDSARVRSFRQRAIDAGYLYRRIPRKYGGSEQPVDVLRAQVIAEEFNTAGAPREVPGIGANMLVPTLLECGEEWQKEKFVRPTIEGDYLWAQGYSEPGSGSDLASLRTRAELVGGEWVINGSKIWTSGAQLCHYMFVLVRTEPEAPKHEGISYLLLDLKQPGVTIRPLKAITGQAPFNQVFFDDARTPEDWIIGRRGEGWAVSKTTLVHERGSVGEGYVEQFEKLVRLAKSLRGNAQGKIEDPVIRDKLAILEGYVWAHKLSNDRQLSMRLAGRDPGPVTLMNKLGVTEINHQVAMLAEEIIGDASLLLPHFEGGGKVGEERWMNQYFGSLGIAIAGGTSNIQRNIIAERGYGLPREQVD